ncbi:uncharacterized protein [Chelonus insularis]|uniref:uncharacterized protein n=1 Tax=Chelonus insularis TaxID=460826 RepID=UPI00158A0FB2|nr:uncharacterized protein LOC118071962 [Chelonus insularis]
MMPIFRSEAFILPIATKIDKKSNNIVDDLSNLQLQPCKSVELCEKVENNSEKVTESNNNEISTGAIKKSCDLNSNVCLPILRINDVDLSEEVKCDMEKNQDTELELNIQSDELYGDEDHIYDIPFFHLRNEGVSAKKDDGESKKEKETDVINLEPIYEVPYQGNKTKQPAKLRERFETGEYVTLQMISKQKSKSKNFPKPPLRTSSLMSIDEREEMSDNLNDDLCCHGYKYGCTTTTKRPEEISKEIFEVNWMKKLEQLRAKEATLKDKETLLFERERLLFRKEKELRILERLIKEKLQHVELCSRRYRSQSNELIHDHEADNKFVEKSKNLHAFNHQFNGHVRSLESLESYSKSDQRSTGNITREIVTQEILKSYGSLGSGISLANEKNIKNPPNSRSSLMTAKPSVELQPQLTKIESEFSHFTNRHSFHGSSAYDSTRIKRKPKIHYDDLDSTLSADIGDSSFVVTSRKFDPEVFKKPYAFTRTLSERRPRPVSERIVDSQDEERKLIRRINDNVFGSYDGNVKFQNYGLIDVHKSGNEKVEGRNITNDRKASTLNLNDEKKKKNNKKDKKINKDRPSSWNEATDEWLQKKRQAYNMQTAKRMLQTNFDNKENHGSQLKISHEVQKKVSKEKKFNIF